MVIASEEKTGSLLRLVTCGSVDDGKSTLIGRLLYESKGIFEDQLASVATASGKHGTTGEKVDLALLTDGLKAEREQGITIDVAYRYFSTPRRPFIIADCPGHEQYTRNMATGASTADVAILLIDARRGVVTQTRRHAFIVSLLGLKHVVLAVNKMDLVGWKREIFQGIVRDFEKANKRIGLKSVHAIPMSALNGDNVTGPSRETPWYEGPALLEHLEELELGETRVGLGFRLPVQLVSRPDLNFRGYMGEVAGGTVKKGDAVVVLPAGTRTSVAGVRDADGETETLRAGEAGTIVLANEVDASRGDVIASVEHPPTVASKVLAQVVWFSTELGSVGTLYRMKQSVRMTTGTLTKIRHLVDVNTLEHHEATSLKMNEIALCEIESARPLVFDAYRENRATGSFVLIDRISGNTVAAGMIVSEIAVGGVAGNVKPNERAVRLGQRAAVVAFTGDTESVVEAAYAMERHLFAAGHLAAVVTETVPERQAAAIEALTGAGLIAIVVGDWTKATVSSDILATDAVEEVVKPVYQKLKSGGWLAAPVGDFEI